MNFCCSPQRHTLVLLLGALILLSSAGHASPWPLDLDVQLHYDYFQQKSENTAPQGYGAFTTTYNLVLKRPITPGMSLHSDLTLNTSAVNQPDSQQSAKGATFNLYTTQPTYSLMSRIDYNNYNSTLDNPTSISSSSYMNNYNAGIILREPALPLMSMQFLRNVTGSLASDAPAAYATNTWLFSSAYNLKALQFTYDRTALTSDVGSTSAVGTTTQRGSVSLDYPLCTGLQLSGALSKNLTAVQGSTSTDMDQRLIRLSATPLRTVTADVQYLTQSNALPFAQAQANNQAITTNVRSEILPGLSADFTDTRQQQQSLTALGNSTLDSDDRSVGVSALLHSGTILSGTVAQSRYDFSGAGANQWRQNTGQLALQTALTPTADFSVSGGQDATDTSPSDRLNDRYLGVSLRDRSLPTLSLGADYHWDFTHLVTTDVPSEQETHTVDLDALWQPIATASLDMRLGYQAGNGSSIFNHVEPTVTCRWQITPATNLGLHYDLSHTYQWDQNANGIFGQLDNNESFNLDHTFRNGSMFNVAYYFQCTNSIGANTWAKQLRLTYSLRL